MAAEVWCSDLYCPHAGLTREGRTTGGRGELRRAEGWRVTAGRTVVARVGGVPAARVGDVDRGVERRHLAIERQHRLVLGALARATLRVRAVRARAGGATAPCGGRATRRKRGTMQHTAHPLSRYSGARHEGGTMQRTAAPSRMVGRRAPLTPKPKG
jgi:hypothetical protein